VRFQGLEEQLHGIDPLAYWIQKRQSSDSRTRDLAAMATDILSIPAMSAEPERVFSRYAIISKCCAFLSIVLTVTASWVVAGIDRVTILSLYQSAVCNETKYRRL